MRAVAAVILKSFHEIKPKLATVLNVGENRALTKAMFHDVLTAALGCDGLDTVVVLSPEEEVLAQGRDRGIATFQEPKAEGMDAAFRQAAQYCREQGGDLLVALPSDLPLLTPGDLDFLLHKVTSTPRAIVVPSTIGPGTSVLVTTPPDAIAPRFEEDDHAAHVEEAEKKAVPVEVVELLPAGLDVDTPKDLARLFLVERSCETRELLEEMDILGRLRPFF